MVALSDRELYSYKRPYYKKLAKQFDDFICPQGKTFAQLFRSLRVRGKHPTRTTTQGLDETIKVASVTILCRPRLSVSKMKSTAIMKIVLIENRRLQNRWHWNGRSSRLLTFLLATYLCLWDNWLDDNKRLIFAGRKCAENSVGIVG